MEGPDASLSTLSRRSSAVSCLLESHQNQKWEKNPSSPRGQSSTCCSLRNFGGLNLKSEQWVLAEDLVKVLRPFEVATTFLSYEENSSISVLLSVLFGLVENLRDSSDDSPTIA